MPYVTLPVATKTTGSQPAREAVTGAALSTRSCRAFNQRRRAHAETDQQHGRATGSEQQQS